MRVKIHGETFLTRPLFPTKDVDKVEKSIFVYGAYDKGVYTTSILGIINGMILNPIGYVMCVDVYTDTNRIQKTYIRKKWW